MNIDKWKSLTAKTKLKIRGQKVTVLSVAHVTESKSLGHFYFVRVKNEENEVQFLTAKIVDDKIDVRLLFEIGWLGIEDRGGHVEKGNLMLFQEPKSENWVPSDLEWAESFNFNIGGRDVAFNRHSTTYGEMRETPQKEGMPEVEFATITEYRAVEKVDNSEVLILEFGGLDENGDKLERGGCVVPLEGYDIDNNEVEKIGWFGF